MKLKLFLIASLLISSNCFGQYVTNKIQRTFTWYSTNSPVSMGFYVEIGVDMATNANPQAFTHSLWNYNPNNSIVSLRNSSISGFPRFTIKDWAGVDTGTMGGGSGGSNLILHSFAAPESHILFTLYAGALNNQIYIFPTVTTNTQNLVVGGNLTVLGSINTANGGVGMTFSSTNVASPGVSNVLVFTNGVFVNTFTIP